MYFFLSHESQIPLQRQTQEARAVAPNSSRARTLSRHAVALFPPAFVLTLLGVWALAETVVPEITDTDYHARLRLMRSAAVEHPDRPLGVLLGSSRTVWAFRPEQLTEPTGTYWVNGAHVGAGPTLNRVILHRLLRDGVRPDVVALEIMPSYFVKENSRFVSGHFAVADLPLARRYADKPFDFDYYFLRHRLTRASDLARVLDPFTGYEIHDPRGGHQIIETDVTPAERAKRTALALERNGPFVQSMVVRPGADRAFRDTIREITEHGARVVLLRAPEGPTFRSWYNPDGLARFDAYIADVAREYGAPVIDARLWLDEEDFYDSHHVLKRGADKFTARFAREVADALRQ